jgi:hypothetical protein
MDPIARINGIAPPKKGQFFCEAFVFDGQLVNGYFVLL